MAKKPSHRKMSDLPAALPRPTRRAFPWIVAIPALAFLLYANTIPNGYALDDYHVILSNPLVQQGIFGIPGILTGPHWYAGEGYRPIPAVMFALEWQFFGANPGVGHFVNALLYALLCALLYAFLSRLRASGVSAAVAVIATLLFAVHPIHTEVVANIKGRDEILCLLFFVTSMLFLWDSNEIREVRPRRSKTVFGLALVAFAGSLLSKESALAFVALVPLVLYFCVRQPVRQLLLRSLPFVGVALLYVLFAEAALHTLSSYGRELGIVNNALAAAPTYLSRLSTATLILGKYLALLVFPHPLVCDYSYNQIPIVGLANPAVLLSVAALLGLVAWGVVGLRGRRMTAFGALLFLVTMAPASNMLVLIGATMGERFLFAPSLGFCLVVALLGHRWYAGHPRLKSWLAVAGTIVAAVLCVTTLTRNADWRDNLTLFSRDIVHSPNSASLNASLGNALIIGAQTQSDGSARTRTLERACQSLQRAVSIHPAYFYAHGNLGLAFDMLGRSDSALVHFRRSYELNPSDGIALMYAGNIYLKNREIDSAIAVLQRAVSVAPGSIDALMSLGDAYALSGDYARASTAYDGVLQVDPGNQDAAARSRLVRLARDAGARPAEEAPR